MGDNDGYSDIVVHNALTKELVYKVSDVSGFFQKDKFYPFRVVELDELEPGRYSFTATNFDDSACSNAIEYIVTGDSKQKILETAIKFSGVKNAEVDLIVEEISDKSNVQGWLFQKYIEAEDEELKEDIALVLDAYVSMLNSKVSNMKLAFPKLSINRFDGSFEMDPSAAHVIRFDITRGNVEQFNPHMLTNKQVISMRDDTLYLYVEIDENGLPMTQQIVFVPNHEIRDKQARQEIDRIDKYRSVIDTIIDYPASYLDFSEEEREYITLIDRLQPNTAWVTAPTIVYEQGYIKAEASEDDFPFYRIFDNLFLAFSEPELCLEPGNQRTIPFSGRLRFQSDMLYMIDEDYFYWVEDSNGKIISDIRLFNFNMLEHEDFNNDVRRLFVSKYQDHLLPYGSVKHPEAIQEIREAVQNCMENEDISFSNLHTRILESLCVAKKKNVFPQIVMCVEEDHVLYGDYYTQFFQSPVRYKYKQDTIVLPPGTDIVYRIDAYKFGERKTSYIPCNPLTAIERRFYNEEFVVISAINVPDMRMSGFILLDFSVSNIRANIYQFLVDTAEVIY